MTRPGVVRVGEVARALDVNKKTVWRRWNAGLLSGPRTDGGKGQRYISYESLWEYVRHHGTPSQVDAVLALLHEHGWAPKEG